MLHPKIIRSLWQLETKPLASSAVTIGSFDGLHLGHKQLITEVISTAHQLNVPSVVLTFVDLPRWQFQQDKRSPQLMSIREKCSLLLEWGIDYIICQYFNVWLRSLSADDFVNEILLKQLNAKAVVIGDDFRFGNNRNGNFEFLQKAGKQLGFNVKHTSTLVVDDERVSSTRIRKLLENHEVAQANQLLGRHYSVSGRVIKGKKLGRTLGFPTANIKLKRRYVNMRGVYVVKVHFQNTTQPALWGVANLGVRPAVNTLEDPLLEVYLLNFDANIYGQYLMVNFYLQLRDEQDFDNISLLKQAIHDDVEQAKKIIKTLK